MVSQKTGTTMDRATRGSWRGKYGNDAFCFMITKPVEVVGSEGGRALGFVTAGGDGSQGTVLDVNVSSSSSFYTLALYTVGDIKPPSRATLNVITPDPLLDVMDSGLYWTMRYNRSVRLRVMPIDSDAGFSAVFFDTE